MKTPKKLGYFVTAITAIGAIIKVFGGAEPPTVNATTGSVAISGQGHQIGSVVIQNIHNSDNTTATVAAQKPGVQSAVFPLVGKWLGTSWHHVPGADLTAGGYSEFLPSGDYNFSGEFTLRNAAKLEPGASIVSKVVAAGKWRVEGEKKYAITLTDLQTVRTVKRRPGLPDVDLDLAAYAAGLPPVRLEKAIPKGASQEFALLELNSTSMESTAQDLAGNRVFYAATRVQ